MYARQKAILLVLFVSLFLIALAVSIEFPLGAGIYSGNTSATNPEGRIRFSVAANILVTLISPPDYSVFIVTGTSKNVNLSCQAINLSGTVNITQIRLYTNLSGAFVINDTINVSGPPPHNVTFNLTNVSLGSYRWNCEAVTSTGITQRAVADWHFRIRQGVPPGPAPSPGGGTAGRPWDAVVERIPYVPDIPVLELEFVEEIPGIELPPGPNLIQKVIGLFDLPERLNPLTVTFAVPLDSSEAVKDVSGDIFVLNNDFFVLHNYGVQELGVGKSIDLTILAQDKLFDYRDVDYEEFLLDNSIPIAVKTEAYGSDSGTKVKLEGKSEIPIVSPLHFVKTTEVVDGYIGVYFVINGYDLETVDDEFIVDFEINKGQDLLIGDILPSIRMVPEKYNLIYKRYKLPKLPAGAEFDLASRIYEKSSVFSSVAHTYREIDEFRFDAVENYQNMDWR